MSIEMSLEDSIATQSWPIFEHLGNDNFKNQFTP
jgi:hypothetical protein